MKKWLIQGMVALQCCTLSAWDACNNNCCDDFCSDFYGEASWLYWQVDSSNYDFLNIRTTVQTTSGADQTNTRQEKDVTQKMPWDSGFRIGFGFNLPCYGLDVKATWTDFHSTGTKKASYAQPTVANSEDDYNWPFSQDTLFVSATGETSNAGALDLSARQKISFAFDPVNLEFGKWIRFDCVPLRFRPHVGVQYLQYHDHRSFSRSSNAQNVLIPITGDYHIKQKFQGFGVRAGFDLAMPLFCDLSLIGNVAASIDWGRNKCSYSAETRSNTAANALRENTLHLTKNCHNSQTLIDLGIGLHWETTLCDCYVLDLEALWEQHQLINGSQLWTPVATNSLSPGIGFYRKSDLTVRGFTLTAGLSF